MGTRRCLASLSASAVESPFVTHARGEGEAGQPDLERRTDVDAVEALSSAKGWLAFGDEAAHVALLLDRTT